LRLCVFAREYSFHSDMNRIGVMHLTDTLAAGGAERMAVNLVNLLPRSMYQPHLCTTRSEGPLAELVADDVKRLSLMRRHRFDAAALGALCDYMVQHDISILHAHGTSLFIAAFASLFPPHPGVVWHDHYGRYKFDDRPAWLYRIAAKRVSRVIAVNQPLAEWSRRKLRMPTQHVEYVPNFVCESESGQIVRGLPGSRGGRIVCVANFRTEKDHFTLIRSLSIVIQQCPAAHLLLIGAEIDNTYVARVRQEVTQRGLTDHISFLGSRDDVNAILKECDVGVLSSASEGLPLALLEYGAAGLPAVATDVGQCGEVLDSGHCGLLVPAATDELLATALLTLLRSSEQRASLADRFQQRVQTVYSPATALQRICSIYEAMMWPQAVAAKPEPVCNVDG
jgi:glycosyltransferase involved in cell wall biosynthesis